MKFTKEELAEALQNKLTANGKKLAMSVRTLNAHVERIYKRLEKTDEETELEDVVTEYLPDFEELEGNYRKDNAAFIKSYKEQWEKEHPAPKKDETNKSEPDDPNKELLAEIKSLRDRLDAQDAEKAVGEKRRQLAEALKAQGVKNEKYINGYIARAALTKDTDIEAEAKKGVEWYNEVSSTIEPSRTPRKTGGETPEDGHEFDDIKAALKGNNN